MRRFLKFLGYDSKLDYRIRLTYIISAISILIAFPFLIYYLFFMEYLVAKVTMTIYIVMLLCSILFLKQGRYFSAKLLVLAGFMFQETYIVFILFHQSMRFELFYFIVAPITFFIFEYKNRLERACIFVFSALAIILFTLSGNIYLGDSGVMLDQSTQQVFSYVSEVSSILSITVVFLFFAREITRFQSELRQLANTDGLTKIYNRRYFYEMGVTHFDLSGRHDRCFSVILLDIDHFKNINDTYGHPTGDTILVQLTELITAQIRKGDIFSRHGGEEFSLILKDTVLEEGVQTAEKIRKSVQAYEFTGAEGQDIRITISAGVTQFRSEAASFDQLISEADKALYEAKEQGRNLVRTLPIQ